MTQWRKSIKDLLDLSIIVCVPILFVILLLLVFGLTDLSDKTTLIILCTAGLVLLISLGMDLVFQHYSEEIRVAEEKEEKQLLFKPSVGILIIFIILLFIPAYDIINSLIKNQVDFDLNVSIGFLVFFTWMWYTVPVFIFAEDSVQIKSHLFYLLGIGRKTVIRYADITSVGPNMNAFSGWGGEGPKHSLIISLNGTTQNFFLISYNDDAIEKIYLRFREKLGDKVKLE